MLRLKTLEPYRLHQEGGLIDALLCSKDGKHRIKQLFDIRYPSGGYHIYSVEASDIRLGLIKAYLILSSRVLSRPWLNIRPNGDILQLGINNL